MILKRGGPSHLKCLFELWYQAAQNFNLVALVCVQKLGFDPFLHKLLDLIDLANSWLVVQVGLTVGKVLALVVGFVAWHCRKQAVSLERSECFERQLLDVITLAREVL